MKWFPATAGLVLGLALYAPALAQAPGGDSLGAGWREQQNEAREAVRQGRLAPLAVIINQIRQRTPGRQLDAGLEQWGDRQVYRIRWMTTDGRRIDYIADAVTGAILSDH
ncbi:MAG: PepSY domain-containing protein [Caulobacteraceae bacterium]|nr:PepSY domain-containing protein [Caulobacteraceae bacterium]